MYQLIYTALEAGLASVILIPILLILNRVRFHSLKTTALYTLFSVYLAGVYAVVGLPNVSYIRFDPNISIVPFAPMLYDLSGTFLNILLFLPFGLFLPLLWQRMHSFRWVALWGFGLSLAIELLQIFTLRATDINDLITNTAGTLLGCLLGRFLRKRFSSLLCRNHYSDLPLLLLCSAGVMFFFQPLIWELIY